MSEEIKYCNICNYLGLDFKTGSFYCSLSQRKDKLPDVLSCEDFKTSDYIQQLKEKINTYVCSTNCHKYIQADKYKRALEEIKEILCEGRTFFDGYFDNPNLSRTDKTIKLINEVLDN